MPRNKLNIIKQLGVLTLFLLSHSINASILNCTIVEFYSPNDDTGLLENATDNPKWLRDSGEFLVDTRTGAITPRKGSSLGTRIEAARNPSSNISVVHDEGSKGNFFNAIYISLYAKDRKKYTNSQIKRLAVEEIIKKAYSLDHLVITNASDKKSTFSYHDSYGGLTTGICVPM